MSIEPTGQSVLIRRDPADKTAGGIIIPDQAKQWAETGTVLAVGPGLRSPKTGERLHLDVETGDRVCFPYSAGEPVTGDNDLLLMHERLIEAVITA